MRYKVERITEFDLTSDIANFIFDCAAELAPKHGNRHKWENFKLTRFVSKHLLWVCYRDDKPVGFLMASLAENFFDNDIIMLRQHLLYALPKTRAAWWLLKEFIDFGKNNANDIIVAIGIETNIKPQSLEKLGFTIIEEIYRMEVKHV